MSDPSSSSTADCIDRAKLISRAQQFDSKVSVSKEEIKENPIIQAIKNGNLSAIEHLIKEANVDIQHFNSFTIQNRLNPINGSALHAAVAAGHLQVVDYLVNCCKLDVNAKTEAFRDQDIDGGFTALHLATLYLRGNVQKEIITYLLEHGADWSIANVHGKQCWELTSDVDLTKLLINFGVGLDSSRHPKSLNIAHKWAKSFDKRSGEVMAFAIEKGVNINQPDLIDGLTPLNIAALSINTEIAMEIINHRIVPISRLDGITALELMGATFISGGQLKKGINFLKMAMEWWSNIECEPSLPKPQTTLTDDAKIVFKDTVEVQTMEELENAALDPNSLKVQAHLIFLRVLGLKHRETVRCLAAYAFSIWKPEPQTFLNYLHLMLKVIDSAETYSWLSNNEFSKLISISVIALTSDRIMSYNNAMTILRKLVSLLGVISESDAFTIDFILSAIVDLTHVVLHHEPLSSQESTDLKSCLQEAVHLQKRDVEGLDLFLIACSSLEFAVENNLLEYNENDDSSDGEDSPKKDDHMEDAKQISLTCFRRIVSPKTISIFIEVGSDVHSVSNEGDTGLHILAKTICSINYAPSSGKPIDLYSDARTSSIKLLREAGVPMDQTNSQGKTMSDILLRYGGIRMS